MNTMRLAAALGISILAASTGFIACGGDDSSPNNPGPDSSLPDGGGGGGNEGGGGGNDSGGNKDAGPLEAAAPNVGKLRCNNADCETDDNYCCVNDAGQACVTNGTACTGPVTGEVHCDEKADCEGASQVCCSVTTFQSSSSGTVKVLCSNTCPRTGEPALPPTTFQRQICKTDAECQDGLKCKTQNCNGAVISACGGVSDNPLVCSN